jgi:hypothetical protein
MSVRLPIHAPTGMSAGDGRGIVPAGLRNCPEGSYFPGRGYGSSYCDTEAYRPPTKLAEPRISNA